MLHEGIFLITPIRVNYLNNIYDSVSNTRVVKLPSDFKQMKNLAFSMDNWFSHQLIMVKCR